VVTYTWEVRRDGYLVEAGEAYGYHQAERDGQRVLREYGREFYKLTLFKDTGTARVKLPATQALRELEQAVESADLAFQWDHGDAAAVYRLEAKLQAVLDYLLQPTE
jgi:hypothetical protein